MGKRKRSRKVPTRGEKRSGRPVGRARQHGAGRRREAAPAPDAGGGPTEQPDLGGVELVYIDGRLRLLVPPDSEWTEL